MKATLDLYMHWLWTVCFALLTITGIALFGPRFGWVLANDLVSADFIHRTMAALYVLLLLTAIVLELLRLVSGYKVSVWMMIGRDGYQMFTLITTLVLIISGWLIWFCMAFSMSGMAFAMMVHEVVSVVALGSIIWHIYMKAHALRLW